MTFPGDGTRALTASYENAAWLWNGVWSCAFSDGGFNFSPANRT